MLFSSFAHAQDREEILELVRIKTAYSSSDSLFHLTDEDKKIRSKFAADHKDLFDSLGKDVVYYEFELAEKLFNPSNSVAELYVSRGTFEFSNFAADYTDEEYADLIKRIRGYASKGWIEESFMAIKLERAEKVRKGEIDPENEPKPRYTIFDPPSLEESARMREDALRRQREAEVQEILENKLEESTGITKNPGSANQQESPIILEGTKPHKTISPEIAFAKESEASSFAYPSLWLWSAAAAVLLGAIIGFLKMRKC